MIVFADSKVATESVYGYLFVNLNWQVTRASVMDTYKKAAYSIDIKIDN
jgi:hypothetical protein